MNQWPDWWQYQLVISPHVIDRMTERGFTETDLRTMLDDASRYRDSLMPGRFIIETTWATQDWEVVVEPDDLEEELIIVTAYRVE